MQTNGIVTSADLSDEIKGIAAKLAQVYDDTLKMAKPLYPKLFNVRSGEGARETVKNISGVEGLKRIKEGNDFEILNVYNGSRTIYDFMKWGGIVKVTRESIVDNEWRNDMDALAKEAKSGPAELDKAAFNVLNSAFSTSIVYNGTDISRPEGGVALLSSNHVLANGDVVSNVLANSDALSADSVAKLKTLIQLSPTESGEPMDFSEGFYLVVPTTLEDLALRITKSTNVQGSNFNDINTHKDVEVIATNRLAAIYGGSDTAYFLVAKNNHGLDVIIREEQKLAQDIDFKSENILNRISLRYAVGFRDWRGVAGSKGDGVPYAG